jgi:hypothetical protein
MSCTIAEAENDLTTTGNRTGITAKESPIYSMY